MVHSLRGKNLNVCQVLAKKSPTAKRGAGKRLRESRLHALDDRRDALSPTDAHRDEPVASAGAVQLVHRLHRQQATGRADWMAKRHCATIGIDLRHALECDVSTHVLVGIEHDRALSRLELDA